MNKNTGLQQRSKRTKRIIFAAAMATVIGGFGAAVTLPASAGSFCAVKSCSGPQLPTDPGSSNVSQIATMTGEGFSQEEARSDLRDACAKFDGTLTITREYSESDEEGAIFYADGDCKY